MKCHTRECVRCVCVAVCRCVQCSAARSVVCVLCVQHPSERVFEGMREELNRRSQQYTSALQPHTPLVMIHWSSDTERRVTRQRRARDR